MNLIKKILRRKLLSNQYFTFEGNKLEYFFHLYNNFRLTERTIEIPIIKYYLLQNNYHDVLEVGNVSNYYYEEFAKLIRKRTVVDKYEIATDVINVDICEYQPDRKFDFIFSVSTFEHMDSDRGHNQNYSPGKHNMSSVASDNINYVINNMLVDGGKMIITGPLGYTPEFDRTFFSEDFQRYNIRSYKRFVFQKTDDISWIQLGDFNEVNVQYNAPLIGTNYLAVIELNK